MLHRSRALISCFAAVVVACSGHVDAPGGGAGAAALPSLGSGGGGKSGDGSGVAGGGAASAGAAADSSGGGALAGGGLGGTTSTGGAGTGGQAGATALAADAELAPTQGNSVTGKAHFSESGGQVELAITLTGCPMGPHAVHLHANAACGDNGNAAGGHWSPQGEGMGDVMCGADGAAQFSFKAPAGFWSIGAAPASDVLLHAVMLHAGPDKPDPGGRIACGMPVKAP